MKAKARTINPDKPDVPPVKGKASVKKDKVKSATKKKK